MVPGPLGDPSGFRANGDTGGLTDEERIRNGGGTSRRVLAPGTTRDRDYRFVKVNREVRVSWYRLGGFSSDTGH